MTTVRVTQLNRPLRQESDWRREYTQAERDASAAYHAQRLALRAEFKAQWTPPEPLPTDLDDPGLSERTVGTHYFDWHHTEADTLDKVSLDDFRKNLASLAVMGFALADMPGRLTAATAGGRAPR